MADYNKQYPMIQSMFKDGIETIFGTLFTDSLNLYLLDETQTFPNIYQEAENKVYQEPIKLIAGINLRVNVSTNPVVVIEKDMVVKIPVKELIAKNIRYETEAEQRILRKAMLEYRGIEYLVDNIKPSSFIADMWHVYAFECTKAVSEKRFY